MGVSPSTRLIDVIYRGSSISRRLGGRAPFVNILHEIRLCFRKLCYLTIRCVYIERTSNSCYKLSRLARRALCKESLPHADPPPLHPPLRSRRPWSFLAACSSR